LLAQCRRTSRDEAHLDHLRVHQRLAGQVLKCGQADGPGGDRFVR
jgi:hypothetical protein